MGARSLRPERKVAGWPSTSEACRRKQRFDDEGEAWTKLLAVRRAGGDPGSTQQPYPCEHCGKWHLGNRPGTRDSNGEVRGIGGRREVRERMETQ